jgi:hypothetical protein
VSDGDDADDDGFEVLFASNLIYLLFALCCLSEIKLNYTNLLALTDHDGV